MATHTHARILATTGELFRRQGYHGTGLKQIVAEARAPFGSVYHHFPGGKEQLGAEVVRTSGALYWRLFPAIFDAAPDLVTGTRDAFRLAGEHLEESCWIDACPIATVTLETASTSELLRQACSDVYEAWVADGTAYLVERGLALDIARRLILALVCALEGAFVLARAWRTTEPLTVAGEVIANQMATALGRG